MDATNDPVRQTLDVDLDLRIDFRTPRWKASPILGEAIDGFLAEITNKIYGCLEVHSMVTHHDRYDVVRIIAFGLFTIVGEDILEGVRSENYRKVDHSDQIQTFDQATRSFTAPSKLWMI